MFTNKRSSGFTIVELMIATVVFGVVIMGVTGAILQMTKRYQHSMYVSRTQAVTSDIVQAVSQSIKYSAATYYGTVQVGERKGYCIGNRAFYYVQGRQLVERAEDMGPNGTRHALVTMPRIGCSPPDIINTEALPADGREMIGLGMRLADFRIEEAADGVNAFDLTVRVVYGADDLLCSEDIAGSCQPGAARLSNEQLRAGGRLKCRTDIGREYCAVSELKTMVQSGL